ncbi:hypothetical protein KJ912_01820, partial [Patescibacteria group bacterium]|nr:hypothetical protein [Patescibacteria group bacterium]
MKNKKAIGFFLFYTLIFTLPVVFFLFSRIPGKYADTFQVWGKTIGFHNLVSDRGVAGALKWQLENFRWTPIETIGWVQEIFSPKAGYNLSWLFSFFVAGLGMYFLVFYLTRNYLASLAAGVIFSFSPFHFSQAISTNIGTMHYEWLCFFVLYLFRFLRTLRIRDFLFMIVFIVIIAMTENQLLAFTLVFAFLFVLFFLAKNYRTLARPRFWLFSLGGILVLFVAVRFMFGGLFEVAHSQDNYLDPGSDQVKRYSTDAVDLFAPSAQHPLWGEKFHHLRQETEANSLGRQSNYIGYTVLFLGLLSLFSLRRRAGVKLFFLGVGVLFVVLSFGPYLHWKGEIMENLWMPYTFLYKYVPYWDIIRTVNRIYVVALLGFSVAAGFGLDFLLKLASGKKGARDEDDSGDKKEQAEEKGPWASISKRAERIDNRKNKQASLIAGSENGLSRWLFWIVVIFISLEYLSVPVPTMKLEYSKFYDNLALEEEDFSIVDIPGATSYDYSSKLVIYNNIHKKNNLAGMDFAREIEDKWDFEKNTPVLNDLLYSLPTGGTPPSKEIVNDYYYNLSTKIFNYYDIRYLIVSKDYLGEDKKFNGQAYENTVNFIDGQLDADLIYEDKFLAAFKVNQSEHLNGWFLAMDLKDDYWGEKSGALGSVMRWARDGAKIRLVNMGDDPKDLRLLFDTSIKNLRKMEVYLNGEKQGAFGIKDKKEEQIVSLKSVKPGDNEIEFRIFDYEGNV